MIVLVVLASIAVYFFMGVTVFTVIHERGKKSCRWKGTSDCDADCGHFVGGIFAGIFWPIAIPIILLAKMARLLSKWITAWV